MNKEILQTQDQNGQVLKKTGHKPTKYKKKQSLESRVNKISHKFMQDKDLHYRDILTRLQTNLTTMHQGNNAEYFRQVRDLEEIRDMNLVDLRYFEEYRVSRSRHEFEQDIELLKHEHGNLVTLCKKKLFEQLEFKIKMLQEEKLLMDVANSHSYSMDYSLGYGSGGGGGVLTRNQRHLTRGESLRLSGEGSDYYATNNSNGGISSSMLFQSGYSSTDRHGSPWHESGSSADDSSALSGMVSGKESGMIGSRRSLRRRVTTKQAERMSNEQEVENSREGRSGAGKGRNKHVGSGHGGSGAAAAGNNNNSTNNSSNNNSGFGGNGSGSNSVGSKPDDPEISAEWIKLVSNYSELNSLLFGTVEDERNKGVYSGYSVSGSTLTGKKRNVGRHSTKTAPPLPSLNKDEVTDDINMLRALLGQEPSPFTSSSNK